MYCLFIITWRQNWPCSTGSSIFCTLKSVLTKWQTLKSDKCCGPTVAAAWNQPRTVLLQKRFPSVKVWRNVLADSFEAPSVHGAGSVFGKSVLLIKIVLQHTMQEVMSFPRRRDQQGLENFSWFWWIMSLAMPSSVTNTNGKMGREKKRKEKKGSTVTRTCFIIWFADCIFINPVKHVCYQELKDFFLLLFSTTSCSVSCFFGIFLPWYELWAWLYEALITIDAVSRISASLEGETNSSMSNIILWTLSQTYAFVKLSQVYAFVWWKVWQLSTAYHKQLDCGGFDRYCFS